MNAKVYDLGEVRRYVNAGFERDRLRQLVPAAWRCHACGSLEHDRRQCDTPAEVARREGRMQELRDELAGLAATAPKHALFDAIKAIKRCELLAEARALAAKEGIPYQEALARVSKEADHG